MTPAPVFFRPLRDVMADLLDYESTKIDLKGHELVLAASGNWMTARFGGEIVDGGAVTFSNSTFYVESSDSKPQFSASFAATASVRLRANAIMNCKQAVPSNGWTLDCGYGNLRGNVVKWPTDTAVPVWDGPIVCTSSSTIAGFAKSGAGTLLVDSPSRRLGYGGFAVPLSRQDGGFPQIDVGTR